MRFPESYLWHLVKNERGTALFAATMAMLLLSITLASFMTIGRDEVLIAQNDVDAVRARFAAEGGANHGRWMLAQRLRNDLPVSVAGIARAAMVVSLNGTYNSAAGAAQFIVDMARGAVGSNFVMCPPGACPEPNFVAEIPDSQQAVLTITSGNPPHTTRVIVSAAGPPVLGNGGQSALFTYSWRVQSTGTSNQTTEPVILDSVSAGNPVGQFTVALQASFVQYAHFINSMNNTDPWISFRHVYTGPVHTNERFNILGNPGGPTFRGEATQTFTNTRFNNGGSAITIASDSTANDQPLLGPFPGTPCQVVDCTGFTRNYDFNPSNNNPPGACPGTACDPIPVPTGAGAPDRLDMIFGNPAAGVVGALGPTPPGGGCVPGNSCDAKVIVANVDNATGLSGNWTTAANATLNGGIFVQGNAFDLQLGAYTGQLVSTTGLPGNGQVVIIKTNIGVNPTSADQRTVIIENRPAGTTTVVRQCQAGGNQRLWCAGAGWRTDAPVAPPAGGSLPAGVQPLQVLTGLLSPNLTANNGVIFVTGDIGSNNAQSEGLRRDPTVGAAVDQSTRLSIGAGAQGAAGIAGGTRGRIYITGNLNYQIDPRGADGSFDGPPATDPTQDDNLGVQNVLGVVSWDGGIYLSPLGLPAVGNLILHGMFMTPNLTGNQGDVNEGEFSFGSQTGDACGTAFRGQAQLLGGVVQMRMGCLGTPGTPGLGYSRNWVYDDRFKVRALSPPVFPGFPQFTTNVSVGIDSYGWRAGRY